MNVLVDKLDQEIIPPMVFDLPEPTKLKKSARRPISKCILKLLERYDEEWELARSHDFLFVTMRRAFHVWLSSGKLDDLSHICVYFHHIARCFGSVEIYSRVETCVKDYDIVESGVSIEPIHFPKMPRDLCLDEMIRVSSMIRLFCEIHKTDMKSFLQNYESLLNRAKFINTFDMLAMHVQEELFSNKLTRRLVMQNYIQQNLLENPADDQDPVSPKRNQKSCDTHRKYTTVIDDDTLRVIEMLDFEADREVVNPLKMLYPKTEM